MCASLHAPLRIPTLYLFLQIVSPSFVELDLYNNITKYIIYIIYIMYNIYNNKRDPAILFKVRFASLSKI